MAFELPRRAFEHARTLTQDEATHFIIDALIQFLAETEETMEALKLRIATLERRIPDPDQPSGG
jgi:hypothetical protein